MLLSRDDLDFSRARTVITVTQKFVIPVAALPDADPLVYPPGTERAGQPIVDWRNRPVGNRGLIFYNRIDECHQAVPADGHSVIIINEVSADHANEIVAFIHQLNQPIHDLSKRSLECVLTHMADALRLHDVYNSTDDFVRANMVPLGPASDFGSERPSGWVRRDGSICRALFVTGPAYFAGPAATPQRIPPDGAFIIQQGEACHMVDAAVMLRTYMNADNSPLRLQDFSDSA